MQSSKPGSFLAEIRGPLSNQDQQNKKLYSDEEGKRPLPLKKIYAMSNEGMIGIWVANAAYDTMEKGVQSTSDKRHLYMNCEIVAIEKDGLWHTGLGKVFDAAGKPERAHIAHDINIWTGIWDPRRQEHVLVEDVPVQGYF